MLLCLWFRYIYGPLTGQRENVANLNFFFNSARGYKTGIRTEKNLLDMKIKANFPSALEKLQDKTLNTQNN